MQLCSECFAYYKRYSEHRPVRRTRANLAHSIPGEALARSDSLDLPTSHADPGALPSATLPLGPSGPLPLPDSQPPNAPSPTHIPLKSDPLSFPAPSSPIKRELETSLSISSPLIDCEQIKLEVKMEPSTSILLHESAEFARPDSNDRVLSARASSSDENNVAAAAVDESARDSQQENEDSVESEGDDGKETGFLIGRRSPSPAPIPVRDEARKCSQGTFVRVWKRATSSCARTDLAFEPLAGSSLADKRAQRRLQYVFGSAVAANLPPPSGPHETTPRIAESTQFTSHEQSKHKMPHSPVQAPHSTPSGLSSSSSHVPPNLIAFDVLNARPMKENTCDLGAPAAKEPRLEIGAAGRAGQEQLGPPNSAFIQRGISLPGIHNSLGNIPPFPGMRDCLDRQLSLNQLNPLTVQPSMMSHLQSNQQQPNMPNLPPDFLQLLQCNPALFNDPAMFSALLALSANQSTCISSNFPAMQPGLSTLNRNQHPPNFPNLPVFPGVPSNNPLRGLNPKEIADILTLAGLSGFQNMPAELQQAISCLPPQFLVEFSNFVKANEIAARQQQQQQQLVNQQNPAGMFAQFPPFPFQTGPYWGMFSQSASNEQLVSLLPGQNVFAQFANQPNVANFSAGTNIPAGKEMHQRQQTNQANAAELVAIAAAAASFGVPLSGLNMAGIEQLIQSLAAAGTCPGPKGAAPSFPHGPANPLLSVLGPGPSQPTIHCGPNSQALQKQPPGNNLFGSVEMAVPNAPPPDRAPFLNSLQTSPANIPLGRFPQMPPEFLIALMNNPAMAANLLNSPDGIAIMNALAFPSNAAAISNAQFQTRPAFPFDVTQPGPPTNAQLGDSQRFATDLSHLNSPQTLQSQAGHSHSQSTCLSKSAAGTASSQCAARGPLWPPSTSSSPIPVRSKSVAVSATSAFHQNALAATSQSSVSSLDPQKSASTRLPSSPIVSAISQSGPSAGTPLIRQTSSQPNSQLITSNVQSRPSTTAPTFSNSTPRPASQLAQSQLQTVKGAHVLPNSPLDCKDSANSNAQNLAQFNQFAADAPFAAQLQFLNALPPGLDPAVALMLLGLNPVSGLPPLPPVSSTSFPSSSGPSNSLAMYVSLSNSEMTPFFLQSELPRINSGNSEKRTALNAQAGLPSGAGAVPTDAAAGLINATLLNSLMNLQTNAASLSAAAADSAAVFRLASTTLFPALPTSDGSGGAPGLPRDSLGLSQARNQSQPNNTTVTTSSTNALTTNCIVFHPETRSP